MNTKLKYLDNVPYDNGFRLATGGVVQSLEQLSASLKTPDDALNTIIFNSHVTSDRNDFVSWIRSIVGYSELADELVSVKTLNEFIDILDKAIYDIKNFHEPVAVPISPLVDSVSSPVVSSPVIPVVSPVVDSVSVPPITPIVAPVVSSPVIPVVASVASIPPVVSSSVIPVVASVASIPPVVTPAFSAPISPPVSVVSPVVDSVPVVSPPVSPVVDSISPPVSVVTPVVDSVLVPPITPIVAPVVIPVVESISTSPAPIIVDPIFASVVDAQNPSVVIEEIFDFEEIFRILVSELEQEILAWDA